MRPRAVQAPGAPAVRQLRLPDQATSGFAYEQVVRGFTEVGDERVGVRETSGDYHLAGFNSLGGDDGEVVAECAAPVVGRDEGDGPAVGDGFELVLEGVDEHGTEWRRAAVRTRVEPPEAGPQRRHTGAGHEGSSVKSSGVTDFLRARRWKAGTRSARGSS